MLVNVFVCVFVCVCVWVYLGKLDSGLTFASHRPVLREIPDTSPGAF